MNEENITFIYYECEVWIEDKYERDDISIFVIEASNEFYFEGSYDNIWISFDQETNEVYRVIEIPDNVYLGEMGNCHYSLENFNSYDEALKYFENLKTISFNKLKKLVGYPHNGNLCYFRTKKKKIISIDDTKVEIVKTFHENGKIKEEIETVNDKPYGLYKEYHDNGQLRVTIRFENGLQVDGVVDTFDENGFLIRTVEIINGNKNGPFKEFYPSGLIKKEGEYKDDEIIGKPIEYFEDGGIKIDNDENEKLNLSDMKLIIKELKVETVLVDFVNNWNKYVGGEYNQLEIETIYDDLDSERDYNGELFSIALDKENNCLFLEIDSPFEAFPLINELFNYNYLMITKSLARIVSKDFDYNFENDDYEELEYTIFTAEDSLEYDNEIVFKGGEYRTKLHISKADWDSYDIEDIDISDDFNLLKYQTVHFVSKNEFADGKWFQTIKSFDLYDWDTYPNEF